MCVVINVHGSKFLQNIVGFVSILDLTVYKLVMLPGLDFLKNVSWQVNKRLELKALRRQWPV